MSCREQALSDDYAELLVDYLMEQDEIPENSCFEILDNQFAILYIDRRSLPPVSVTAFVYNSIPKVYGLMQEETSLVPRNYDPLSLVRSGIIQVQRPPLSLTGRGVVLGFVDTGIRYDSAVFKREDGSSRILAIWDQTIQNGEPPQGFSFGTEYTNAQINEALRSGDPLSVVPSTDTIGHGSEMASVAAGSNVQYGLSYLGAAPDADIVMVKCREAKTYLRDYYFVPDGVPAYSEADIGLAVKYLDSFARVGNRPVVICIGMGTNWGDHSGGSVLARYLNRIATRRNRAVVVCGGNEGNAAHHYNHLYNLAETPVTETVEVRVGDSEPGFLMELWGNTPNVMSVSIRSPGGEMIPAIDFRSRETRNFTFIYERTRIAVDHILVEQTTGDELIVFRFTDPTPGVWTFEVQVEGDGNFGTINMWLPITQFLRAETYFLRSSPYLTLTEPSYAANVITPSTYDDNNNSFYINSGRGYTRSSRTKPDFAAPGVNVSTLTGSRSGSSMSAAITAGGAAQFMQWAVIEGNAPLAQSDEVKAYFIRGAVRSPDVIYPNREWGFGRLNVARAFEVIAGI